MSYRYMVVVYQTPIREPLEVHGIHSVNLETLLSAVVKHTSNCMTATHLTQGSSYLMFCMKNTG